MRRPPPATAPRPCLVAARARPCPPRASRARVLQCYGPSLIPYCPCYIRAAPVRPA